MSWERYCQGMRCDLCQCERTEYIMPDSIRHDAFEKRLPMNRRPSPVNLLTRRQFFRKTLTISTLGLLTLQAGCEPTPPPLTSCQDLSRLSEDETKVRTALAYVDETPYPAKRCDNCQFWLMPAEDAACGGCTILKGPIEAKGYCSSWAPPPATPVS